MSRHDNLARIYPTLDSTPNDSAQIIANACADEREAILARLRALLARSGDHMLALDLRLLIAEMESGNGKA